MFLIGLLLILAVYVVEDLNQLFLAKSPNCRNLCISEGEFKSKISKLNKLLIAAAAE